MDPERGGFSVDQLMELAGLSVAQALAKMYPKDRFSRILVCAGMHFFKYALSLIFFLS